MNTSHFKVIEVNAVWCALRDLQQHDLSRIHMIPPPADLPVRVQHQGKLYAADRLTEPLTVDQAFQVNLNPAELKKINAMIVAQNT